ncbi:MAG TPA: phosphoribosylglycinamide formyltransferase [Verrucomicrobiales bacterium]|nr:phosphoribosylglycinamide formyltransferase [Verrucomicrobiales bacterium]
MKAIPPSSLLLVFRRTDYAGPVSSPSSFRLGVLGSGKGTNFLALADAISAGRLPAKLAIVLSDVTDSGILTHATERGIPAQFITPGTFRTKLDEAAESAYLNTLREAKVDLVVLAGFMRILKGEFLRAFEGRVINIHPSLLPSFPGLMAWKQALDYGVKVTGCTVHYVDQGVDTGPIIGQRAVPVVEGDTADTLHARIQVAERELYPAVVGAIARGEVQVRGRLARGFSS